RTRPSRGSDSEGPMTTVAEQPASQAPASGRETTPEQHLLLFNVNWQSYVAIGDALPDRPHLRMTHGRGNLECMTTSSQHEFYKKCISRLIDAVAEEYGFPSVSAGQMTFQRPDLERGMEPDDCFWIAHERQMRGRLDYDPRNDPPPDLLLEIE